jgi:cell division protein FtsL
VAGVLLDLGISSPQVDNPARGFSFRFEGPLDMRMDTTRGQSVAQWLAHAEVNEIAEVIREYGEERFAGSIAKAIVARRQARGPLVTTTELATLVADTVKTREPGQNPATRTFQAFRIFINAELEELQQALKAALSVLQSGGRLVVISFHSLEDRIVKQFMAANARPVFDRRAPFATPQPMLLKVLGRSRPGDAEVAANPRARSAIMRVAERTSHWGASMTRFNLVLLLGVVLSALYLVNVQYDSRRLYSALDRARSEARKLAIENESLQVEKRAQATSARVEALAKSIWRCARPTRPSPLMWPITRHQRHNGTGGARVQVAGNSMSRSIAYTSSPLLASPTPVWRSKFIVAAIALAFAGLAARAVYIQVLANDFFQRQGEVRYARTLELPANRGRILDRNGVVMASSIPVPSIWAIPEDVRASQPSSRRWPNCLACQWQRAGQKARRRRQDLCLAEAPGG